jgi:hypothetical protein
MAVREEGANRPRPRRVLGGPRDVADSQERPWLHRLLVAMLLAELVVAGYVLLAIWDPVMTAGQAAAAAGQSQPTGAEGSPPVSLFGLRWSASAESLYLLTVIVLGAVGSSIHALTSLATYLGNRQLRYSWTMWYLVRLPIGVSLALIFYFLLRGGLFSVGAEAADVNPFGIGAIAALAGMFSKQATDKLQETFDTLFRTAPTEGDAVRGDKVTPTFAVDHLSPASLPVGAAELTVWVFGSGFTADTVVRIGGAERTARQISSSELEVRLATEDVYQPGLVHLRLAQSSESNAATAEARLRVRPRVDRVAATDPGDPLRVRIEGDGFVDGTQVAVEGQARGVEAWEVTWLEVRLVDDDRAHAADRQLRVGNPSDRGGDADAMALSQVEGWA